MFKLTAIDEGLRWFSNYCGCLLPNEPNAITAVNKPKRQYIQH